MYMNPDTINDEITWLGFHATGSAGNTFFRRMEPEEKETNIVNTFEYDILSKRSGPAY